MLCCRDKPSGAGLWFSCCNEYPWTAVPKWPGLLHRWRSWVIQFIFADLNELKWEHNLAWSFSLMFLIIKPRIIDAFSTMPKITSHSNQAVEVLPLPAAFTKFIMARILPHFAWMPNVTSFGASCICCSSDLQASHSPSDPGDGLAGEKNHGMTGWFVWERTFRKHLVPLPLQCAGTPLLDQSPVYADLERFQVCSTHHCSGQPVAVILSLLGITGQRSPTINLCQSQSLHCCRVPAAALFVLPGL